MSKQKVPSSKMCYCNMHQALASKRITVVCCNIPSLALSMPCHLVGYSDGVGGLMYKLGVMQMHYELPNLAWLSSMVVRSF